MRRNTKIVYNVGQNVSTVRRLSKRLWVALEGRFPAGSIASPIAPTGGGFGFGASNGKSKISDRLRLVFRALPYAANRRSQKRAKPR